MLGVTAGYLNLFLQDCTFEEYRWMTAQNIRFDDVIISLHLII